MTNQRAFWLTEEVAEHYRVKPETVRYWRHIGYGPKGVRNGRRMLYPQSEIERWDAELLAKASNRSRDPEPWEPFGAH